MLLSMKLSLVATCVLIPALTSCSVGPNVLCPEGQYLRGIKDGKAICVAQPSAGTPLTVACPSGQVLSGLEAGEATCVMQTPATTLRAECGPGEVLRAIVGGVAECVLLPTPEREGGWRIREIQQLTLQGDQSLESGPKDRWVGISGHSFTFVSEYDTTVIRVQYSVSTRATTSNQGDGTLCRWRLLVNGRDCASMAHSAPFVGTVGIAVDSGNGMLCYAAGVPARQEVTVAVEWMRNGESLQCHTGGTADRGGLLEMTGLSRE